jgi:hypothetical protein
MISPFPVPKGFLYEITSPPFRHTLPDFRGATAKPKALRNEKILEMADKNRDAYIYAAYSRTSPGR